MPSTVTGKNILTANQIATYAKAAGFTGPDLIIAVAVCLAESGGKTDAVNVFGKAYGLMQVRLPVWPNLLTPEVMAAGTWADPAVNMGFAYHIQTHMGWRMWNVYTSGSYLKHMDAAKAAVATLEVIVPAHIDSFVLPSNQKNPTGLYPAAPKYEKDIWLPAAQHFRDEMEDQGHTCTIVYVEPTGTASTDELLTMVQITDAEMGKVDGYKLAVSLHSNTGSGTNYMMGMGLDAHHDAFIGKVTADAAKRTGIILRPVYHRSIYFTRILDHWGPGHVILFETGEHQTAKGAMWLKQYAPFAARMEARACIVACGFDLKSDGPMDAGIAVPPGAAFDKYRPGATPNPSVVGSIAWVETKLEAHYTGDPAVLINGVWDASDAALLKKWQSEHYWNGKKLPADGLYPLNAPTLAKLKAV
jgi:hypothetical protein